MIFREAPLPGVMVIEPEPAVDERGFFARVFDHDLWVQHGLQTSFPQWSVSFNTHAGTLRGLHFQEPPHDETKIVRCTAGAVYDVVVDLRRDSATYLQWWSIELTSQNRAQLYIPAGLAHGFQTLVDGTELLYQISRRHCPAAARGIRWDDPVIGISWPDAAGQRTISERDRGFPGLSLD